MSDEARQARQDSIAGAWTNILEARNAEALRVAEADRTAAAERHADLQARVRELIAREHPVITDAAGEHIPRCHCEQRMENNAFLCTACADAANN
jgi:hypothetical protein